MRKIWTFIKKVLKRLLPPTVHVFMREVNGLHGAMAAREANLSHQLGVAKAETQSLMKQIEEQQARRLDRMEENISRRIEVAKQESHSLMKMIEEQQARRMDRMEENQKSGLDLLEERQGKRLDRLGDLFESANRENLRLFFDSREERKEMDARYAQLAEEMKKLQARQEELEKKLDKGQNALFHEQKHLEMGVSSIRKISEEGARNASESVWADIFNQTVSDSTWLIDKTFAPGRWAVGYPYLYVMFRVLNETKPKRILELGLGQSTRMIAQYAAAHEGVEHFVVEHDPAWIEFFVNGFTLPTATKIVQLPWDYVTYKEAESVRVYKDFQKTFAGQWFDFISIDGPLGADMKKYSRINVLQIMPDCFEKSFVVMIDDYDREGEKNTVREMEMILKEHEILYEKGGYKGVKELCLLASLDMKYLTSL